MLAGAFDVDAPTALIKTNPSQNGENPRFKHGFDLLTNASSCIWRGIRVITCQRDTDTANWKNQEQLI